MRMHGGDDDEVLTLFLIEGCMNLFSGTYIRTLDPSLLPLTHLRHAPRL